MVQITNHKRQIPKLVPTCQDKFQFPNPKFQKVLNLFNCHLKFIWDLKFGIWNFGVVL